MDFIKHLKSQTLKLKSLFKKFFTFPVFNIIHIVSRFTISFKMHKIKSQLSLLLPIVYQQLFFYERRPSEKLNLIKM